MLISNFLISKILNQIRLLKHYEEDDIDVIRYSLEAILWEIEKIIILLVVFTLLGKIDYFLIACFTMMSIRTTAGGYHANTALGCLTISFIIFFLAIILLPQISINQSYILIFAIFSLFVIFLAAPMPSIKRLGVQKNDKILLRKMISFTITLSWFILIFIYKDNTYVHPILWVNVLLNIQLLLEYIRRKRKMIC